jgi:hypothetical protein
VLNWKISKELNRNIGWNICIIKQQKIIVLCKYCYSLYTNIIGTRTTLMTRESTFTFLCFVHIYWRQCWWICCDNIIAWRIIRPLLRFIMCPPGLLATGSCEDCVRWTPPCLSYFEQSCHLWSNILKY